MCDKDSTRAATDEKFHNLLVHVNESIYCYV